MNDSEIILIFEYALLLMSQQLLHVYNNECCCYDDKINGDSNFDMACGYYQLAVDKLKGKTNDEIRRMIVDIRNMDGFDKIGGAK